MNIFKLESTMYSHIFWTEMPILKMKTHHMQFLESNFELEGKITILSSRFGFIPKRKDNGYLGKLIQD